jgi:hypothetical protein
MRLSSQARRAQGEHSCSRKFVKVRRKETTTASSNLASVAFTMPLHAVDKLGSYVVQNFAPAMAVTAFQ